MLSLVIDRVKNINVFNLFENYVPTDEAHLQSTIDDDLILEYVGEVNKLVKVSQAVLNQPNQYINANILKELRILGETFFNQFFPAPIIEKLRTIRSKSAHFNIDPSLAIIPWDLLHDGNSFLSDRFYIGKTVKGGLHASPSQERDKIRMLIISDPTEDLPGAQKEGEMLFSILSQRISSKTLELEFVGGKQVTKLKLLSLIKDKHVIHYSGHLHFSDDSLENGWLLSDNKVLKAREIKATGIKTDLVFSNSCLSSKSSSKTLDTNILNQYAGAFLSSGIKTFIGTNWEIPDSENTIDFTIRFYSFLFGQKSVGESLFLAKEYARRNNNSNDLTWANYSLFGNPNFNIFPTDNLTTMERRGFNPALADSFFPSPLVSAYSRYVELLKSGASHKTKLIAMIQVFEAFSKVVGMLIFSDHHYHSLGQSIPNNLDDALSLKKWWDLVFTCLWDFRRLNILPFFESVYPIMENHKEVILKILNWLEEWGDSQLPKAEPESYLILFEFFIHNLLSDLTEFEKISIVVVSENSQSHYVFKGTKPGLAYFASEHSSDSWLQGLNEWKGSVVAVHFGKKKIIPFPALVRDKKEKGDLDLIFPGFLEKNFASTKL